MGEIPRKLEWHDMDCRLDLPIDVQDKKVAECIDAIFLNLVAMECHLKDKTDERSNFLREYYLNGGWRKGLTWEGPADPEMLPMSPEESEAFLRELQRSLKTFRVEVEVDDEVVVAQDIHVADIQTAWIRATMMVDVPQDATSFDVRIREVDTTAEAVSD